MKERRRSIVARLIPASSAGVFAAVCVLEASSAASSNLPMAAAAPKGLFAQALADVPRTVGVPIPGTQLVRGRSTLTIAAPIDKVRDVVLDFAHYAEFMPHYKKCRVLSRSGGGAREVYMEIAALHGAVTMWARIEVTKAAMVDGVEVHETKFLEGNVKDLKATFRLKKLDEKSTEFTLDIFLHPQIPLPDKVINQENLSGSAEAVLAIQRRAVGR